MSTEQEKIERMIAAEREYFAAFKELAGHFPLVLHRECYKYFNQPCKIVEANVFNNVSDCEVTVEGPFGDREFVTFDNVGCR